MRAFAVLLAIGVLGALRVPSGCGSSATACPGSTPDCLSGCGSDYGWNAVCVDGKWACDGGVMPSTCPCGGAPSNIRCPLPGKIRCAGTYYVCDEPDAGDAGDAAMDASGD